MFFCKKGERESGLFFRYGFLLHAAILSPFPNSLHNYLIRDTAPMDTGQSSCTLRAVPNKVESFGWLWRPKVRKSIQLTALLTLMCALACTATAQTKWPDPDASAISRFKDEGMQYSHVMETMSYLTDVYGPRLTNSPNIRQAAEYAVKTLGSWGLSNVHEEIWGPFGRGWSNELFEADEISPRHFSLIAYPKAWTRGTAGSVTAEVVYAKIEKEQDFEEFRGRLKDKFVMTAPLRRVDPQFGTAGASLNGRGTGRTRPARAS